MEAAKMHQTINSLLECGICLKVYTNPRILPCGHTFCLSCIQSSNRLSCALCKRPWVNIGSAHELPKNFVVESFIVSIPSVSECALADKEKHGPAEFFCIDCWDPLCAVCSDGHRRFVKHCKDHVIKNISDVSQEDMEQHNRQKTSMCSQHKSQEIALYCTQCENAVCSTCCIMSHSDHMTKCKSIDEIDKMFITSIGETIKKVEELVRECNETIAKIPQLRANLTKERDELLASVHTFSSNIKKQLEDACEEAKKQVDAHDAAAVAAIDKQVSMEEIKLSNVLHTSNGNRTKALEFLEVLQKNLPPLSSATERSSCTKTHTTAKLRQLVVHPNTIDNIHLPTAKLTKWKGPLEAWLRLVLKHMSGIKEIPQLKQINDNGQYHPTKNTPKIVTARKLRDVKLGVQGTPAILQQSLSYYGQQQNVNVGCSYAWCFTIASSNSKDQRRALWVVHAPDGRSWQLDKMELPNDSGASKMMKVRLNQDGVNFDSRTAIAYDGSSVVFVSDYVNSAVHCWSIDGVYIGRVGQLSVQKPCCLAVDAIKERLFVGQEDGVMKVFDLYYC